MPSVKDIEAFKEVIDTLGGERDILSRKEEAPEPLSAAEEGLAPELSELLQPLGEESAETPPGEEPPLEPLDFASLFEESEEREPSPPAAGPPEEPGAEPGAELGAEPAAGPSEEGEPSPAATEELRLEDFEFPEREPEGEAEGEAAEPETGEVFDELDIPQDFELAEEAAPPAPAEPSLEEPSFEEPSAPSEETFAVPEAVEPEAPEPEAAVPEAEGGFEIPSFEEEAPAPPSTPPAPPLPPSGEFEIPEEFAIPTEEPVAAGLGEEEAMVPPGAGAEEPEAGETAIPPVEEALGAAGLGEEEFKLDDFSLQGLGEEFGIKEEEAAALPEAGFPPPGAEEERPAEEEVRAAEEELALSEPDFGIFRRALDLLPRNLKIAIEELIGEKELGGEELKNLVDLLVQGAAPVRIAEQVTRLTGKKIVLPRSFEKRTGLAFEMERATFAYAFRENILPVLRLFVLGFAAVVLVGYAGYSFVFKPIYAYTLYDRGYAQLKKDRFPVANELFDRAAGVWAMKGWFYRYAEGFTARRQYLLARQKYEQLLKRFPLDRKGILDEAGLESRYLADYEGAERLLKQLLDRDVKDYQALLAAGDNYLEWAEEDPKRFEDARFAYANLLDYYGERDEVLFRMMRYFIRSDRLKDKQEEVLRLKTELDDRKGIKIDAEIYAELGGYLLDKRLMEEAPDALFRALKANRELPEVHYHLARYFEYMKDPGEEEKGLKNALLYLKTASPLSRKRLFMQIDSLDRYGRLQWKRKRYLDAEARYQEAVRLIEDGQKRKLLPLRPELGEVYVDLGDLYYYVERNLGTALAQYRKAEENGFSSDALNFKVGYIQYAEGRYDEALLRFVRTVEEQPRNPNALYALGNSLYQVGNFASAQGYFAYLLDRLEARKNEIPFLRIHEEPEHKALIEMLMRSYNNLGVTFKKLYDQRRDRDRLAKALLNLTFSSEYYDLLSRDPETLERGETKNLAFLNQKGILYPVPAFEPQIFIRIPQDLEALRF